MKIQRSIERLLLLLALWILSTQAYALCQAGSANNAVSEATPSADFIDNGDGTVTHLLTGLIWDRCSWGQTWDATAQTCTGNASTHNWRDALGIAVGANTLSHLGHEDWRLPSEHELLTIVETCGHAPAINEAIFPSLGNGSAPFWSSTFFTSSAGATIKRAWFVDFQYGLDNTASEAERYRVRLVRAGNRWDAFGLLRGTRTRLDASPISPAVFGQGITLTATVEGVNNGTPTGSVQFLTNGMALSCDAGNQNLDASGQATCVLNALGAGDYDFTARYLGDANFDPSSSDVLPYRVNKADQRIENFAANPATGIVGGQSTLSATASSGLPVVFGSATPVICRVVGNQVQFLQGGTCIVTADQGGDANYNAAVQQQLSITVNKLAQSIQGLSAVPSLGVEGGQSTLSATASSGLPVVFGSATPAICRVVGNQVQFLQGGTCIVTADQGGDAIYNAAPQARLSIVVLAASEVEPKPVPSLSGWGLLLLGGLIGSLLWRQRRSST